MLGKNRGLTRRDFIIKSAGITGLLAILSSPLIPVFNRVKASVGTSETTLSEKKVRAWCMVIDLKKCEGCVTINEPPQSTQACITGHFVTK